MPKVNIKVVIRLRPISKTIDLLSTSADTVTLKNKQYTKSYRFNRVFDERTTQQEVYAQSGIDELVQHVVQGYNSTVFAYGQTSAGKTYTMEGYQYDPKTLKPIIEHNNQGVVQRAIKSLYCQTKKKENLVSISCSFLQIYNQKLYDLLKPIDMNQSLKLRWDKDNEFSVENLSQVICHTEEEMIKMWQQGIKKRIVASNQLNIASSRSHTIFRINVETRHNEVSYISRLQLVDLAGSQRTRDLRPTKESIQINKSLFTLKKVINALEAGECYIPYRQSKLTSLLKHSVGGNSYCLIIACINPADDCIQHTISTLNYASKAKTIMNSIEQIINSKDRIILTLKRENQVLREELRVAQKEIQLLTRLGEKKYQKPSRGPSLPSPSHLVEMHTNMSPSPEYFSQRLVESINTVRDLLKSNKILRDDLDKMKQKSQNYAKQISILVGQNEQLKNICIRQDIQQVSNKTDYKIKRLSVGKITEREKEYKQQLFKINTKMRVSTEHCQIPQEMNISLPKFSRVMP